MTPTPLLPPGYFSASVAQPDPLIVGGSAYGGAGRNAAAGIRRLRWAVLANARTLAARLQRHGLDLLSGGTDTPLVLQTRGSQTKRRSWVAAKNAAFGHDLLGGVVPARAAVR